MNGLCVLSLNENTWRKEEKVRQHCYQIRYHVFEPGHVGSGTNKIQGGGFFAPVAPITVT